MGGPRWSATDWDTYTTKTHVGKKTKEIYRSSTLAPELDPKGVTIREARDSELSPESNAIIIGLDVTGSMHSVLDAMARNMNTLVTEIYNRKPVTDPHIMCMGIGDVEYDRHPLQVTQFETDIRICQQLEKIYLESGGGGNSYESYAFAWYFAGMHTSIDCFEKRGKKGYLFTVGDEGVTPYLKSKHIGQTLGSCPEEDQLTADQLLAIASKYYNVYHIMVEEGNHFRMHGDAVVKQWTNLLGQRAIRLADHKLLTETIVSLIQVNEGVDKDDVINSWDGSTAVVVAKAIKDLKTGKSIDSDIVSF